MRRIKFVLFLLIALLLFSGCTNSQKEYQSLVGTWETSIDYTPLGYSDIVIYQLTFEKDLTGTLYISESSTSPETTTHFDYSVENNYITFVWEQGNSETSTFVLDNSQLILNESNFPLELTRIK